MNPLPREDTRAPRRRGRAASLVAGAAVLAAVGLAGWGMHARRGPRPQAQPAPAAPPQSVVADTTTVTLLPPHTSLDAYLRAQGIAPTVVQAMLTAARPVYNLNHVQAGNRLELVRHGSAPTQLTYQVDAIRQVSLQLSPLSPGGWLAWMEATPYEIRTQAVGGTVEDSLFGAVEAAGEGDHLALALAGIFGWDLDFYTDPRPGDTWRALVEKKYRGGVFAGYGDVLAAEYVNAGRRLDAVRFADADGVAYYHSDGTPMRRAFLHSPLQFAARVTSGFSLSRYHPILKIYRAHLGTDYAAPAGTPVQAIGDGVVEKAGDFGEDGNMVQLKHRDGYQTLYLHLSRILVRTGEQVHQGDRVGLVGMTGLATGPHLDFRIEHNSVFEDFEVVARDLPRADPVPSAELSRFRQQCEASLAQMAATQPAAAHR